MRDVARIRIQAYLDIDADLIDVDSVLQVMQNELGFTGLDIVDAEVTEYIEDVGPDDDISLEQMKEREG